MTTRVVKISNETLEQEFTSNYRSLSHCFERITTLSALFPLSFTSSKRRMLHGRRSTVQPRPSRRRGRGREKLEKRESHQRSYTRISGAGTRRREELRPVQTLEDERWRATSPGDARTRRGKSGSKTQECENRLLSAFPGENGSRRGRSLPRRWQPRPDALSENRGFNSRPPIVLSPSPLAPSHPAAIRALERNFTPCRFRIRKNIRFSLISSIYFLSFNDIVTNRRNLLPDNYSSNNLKGRAIRSPRDLSPSKQEWIGYYRESVYNSRYASTWPVNRPIKWSCKSSLLTLT